MSQNAPGRWTAWLWLAGAVWTIPLWLVPLPPMVDYPQQLAAAAIIRFYGDPARALQQAYELVLWRPHGLFELLTAGLAWLLPIDAAGKLVVSLCLAAVSPAVLALCRRTGRPGWYALLALPLLYNHTFYWGLVDNLLAYPLLLAGVALADRSFDRPFGVRSWLLLAGWTVLFYGAHLEMMLVFGGCAGWLALARRPSPRRLALWLSPLLPGVALGMGVLGWAHFHAAEVMTGYQQRLKTQPTHFRPPWKNVIHLPDLLFGSYTDGMQLLLAAFLLAVLAVLIVPLPRRSPASPASPAAPDEPERAWLERTRFATLAGWVGLLFFVLPEFHRGYLMSDRLAPVAVLLAIPALPVPSAARRRAAAALLGGLLALQLLQTSIGFLAFADESAGLRELLDQTAPGQTLAGLMYETTTFTYYAPPLLEHFPAYYQVYKGGRVHFSFVQFFNSPVAYRPGQNWESDILAEWDEWNPQLFSLPRHGGAFRYFLARAEPRQLAAAFGPYLRRMRVLRSGGWYLVERPVRPRLP